MYCDLFITNNVVTFIWILNPLKIFDSNFQILKEKKKNTNEKNEQR